MIGQHRLLAMCATAQAGCTSQIKPKIGKKQWVYAFTFWGGPAAQEGEAVTRIRESKQRSFWPLCHFGPIDEMPSMCRGPPPAQTCVPPPLSKAHVCPSPSKDQEDCRRPYHINFHAGTARNEMEQPTMPPRRGAMMTLKPKYTSRFASAHRA